MGLFSRKTSSKPSKDDDQKKPAKEVKKPASKTEEEVFTPESQTKPVKTDGKKAAEKAAPVAASKGQAGESFRLLLGPKVSEKAADLASKNVYVFNVPVTAEKIEIGKAVEKLYGVKVVDVRTARGKGKPVYRGRKKGQRKQWKKAFVAVKKGQTIDLYEGV